MAEASGVDEPELSELRRSIEHAAHYLPAQGPINVFIHHNTLHAFEEFTFDEGVQRGSKLFGCQPYLSAERYREMFDRGRIRQEDVDAVLQDDLGDRGDVLIGFMGTRFYLRQAMLRYSLQTAPTPELRWFMAETDALARFRPDAAPEIRTRFLDETRHWILRDVRANGHIQDLQQVKHLAAVADLIQHFGAASIESWSAATWESFTLRALWRICRRGVHSVKKSDIKQSTSHRPHPEPTATRHRDLLLEATGHDIDQLVNEVLIRFCSAFLDQGFARWGLPAREQGFFQAFAALYGQRCRGADGWLADLPVEIARLKAAQQTPLAIVHESLEKLGVAEAEREQYIIATLLALRGWAGMIQQLEIRGDRVAHPIPAGSLVEVLAVRLLLERMALQSAAREKLGYEGPLDDLRSVVEGAIAKHESTGVDQRALQIFQLAQVLGWLPPALAGLSQREWTILVGEIEAFPAIERRRVLHAAYERRYRNQSLDAIAVSSRQSPLPLRNPRFQLMCCLDEREESFRRHVEELAPNAETFGPAGFFSVPIYYRGVADSHFVPLCPIVIRPKHWVAEHVDEHHSELGGRRAKTRKALGMATHGMHIGSRSFAGGAILAASLGALAAIPLVARVLFPRLTASIRQQASALVAPPSNTHLELERAEPAPAPDAGHLGFTLDEMCDIGERLLRDIGLTSNFAPLVIVLGHGSNSLNNPHNSAYNCGACGGNCGGPNARALAQILNDPRVRVRLAERGVIIPAESWVVGGWHNTCNDHVTFFDLDRIPSALQGEFQQVREIFERACEHNAHERCRRFMSAPLNMTPWQALRHVEARSEDLAQTRPECGHATNALCIVGRRSRTRGLYMDRRAFLTSYDPTQDDDRGTILERLLGAAVPVCGGINLEYYFSYVDNVGFGCGTKLPHNVTSLLGVMDGAASDLRTGLPWQMVEIHEPVRLLMVIETTPDKMNRIMDRNPSIGNLVRKGWVQMATLSPQSSEIHLLQGDRFVVYKPEVSELPQVTSSVDWYRGWRDHLGYALIVK